MTTISTSSKISTTTRTSKNSKALKTVDFNTAVANLLLTKSEDTPKYYHELNIMLNNFFGVFAEISQNNEEFDSPYWGIKIFVKPLVSGKSVTLCVYKRTYGNKTNYLSLSNHLMDTKAPIRSILSKIDYYNLIKCRINNARELDYHLNYSPRTLKEKAIACYRKSSISTKICIYKYLKDELDSADFNIGYYNDKIKMFRKQMVEAQNKLVDAQKKMSEHEQEKREYQKQIEDLFER
jgi:hypothetical protein